MRDEFRQSFALLPRHSDPWIRVTKPTESSVKKFICGGGAPTATLPIEGPAIDELSGTIMFRSHSPEPMVDQRGLSNASPSHNCDDIYIRIGPCIIQESDIFLSTKKIASSNWQSGYSDVLRSCGRLAGYGVGISIGPRPQALISNCKAFIDSARYRRQRLQKFGRCLKTPFGIFIEQHFNEADDRLRNPLEFLKRQGSVLMLRHNSGGRYPERARDRSASARAKRQASRDPNGYPPLLR